MKKKYTIWFFMVFLSFVCFGQCPSDVIINTNNYSASLTQSATYIKISSSVSNASNVKLDAHPVNGYVQMDPGFRSFPNSGKYFIAQPLDGCGSNSPSKVFTQNEKQNSEIMSDYEISIYPNPSTGKFTINSSEYLNGSFSIYEMNAVRIFTTNITNKMQFEIDLREYSSGVYLLEINSNNLPAKSFRLIKR